MASVSAPRIGAGAGVCGVPGLARAVRVAVAVLGEVGAEGPLDGGEGLGSPADPREVRVVPRGESHDHDGVTRFRAEVPRETTVQVVADPRPALRGVREVVPPGGSG